MTILKTLLGGGGASKDAFAPRPGIPRSDTQSAVEYVQENAGAPGPGVYAPTDAQYLTRGTEAGLSNERAVIDTTTITWDWSSTGQAKANLTFLGIEALTDPAADRVMAWDDSEGAVKFLTPSNGLAFVGTYLSITDPDLSFIVNASFVQGDVLYHDGTTLARLPAGVMGQFLRTQGSGSAPNWEYVPGGGDMLRSNNLIDLTNTATARTNLGVAIGSNVQAYDATLQSLSSLGTAANRIAYTSGVDTWAETTLTAFGRTLIDDVDAATALATLGAQPLDAELTAFAGLTSAADKLGYFTGSGTMAVTDLTATARTLLDDGSTSAMRSTLGLVIGTDVQAQDAELAAIAGLTSAADRLPYFTGSGTASLATFTSFGRSLVDDADAATARTTLGVAIGTNVQGWDADLDAIAALGSTGIAVRTAANTWAQRSIAAPAAGISISNADGASGNPTLALANDLSALEGLGGTGFAVRSTTDTWVQRIIANASAGLTWINGDGIGGNPTPVFANDLGAIEALSGTGLGVRSGTDTWVQRSIAGTANEITLTNGDGVSGNPTASLPSALTFTGKTVTGGTFASPAAITGLPDPTNAQDAATKAYVDSVVIVCHVDCEDELGPPVCRGVV